MNEALASDPHQREDPPSKRSNEEFHETLDISSIDRKELMFVTYGYIRHTFAAPKTYNLMKAATEIQQLVALCKVISLHEKIADTYLVLVQSISLGSWLIVKSIKRHPPNAMCTVVGITVQIGNWIVCEGTIKPCAGSGMLWNEYLSEIERRRKQRGRNNNIRANPRTDPRTDPRSDPRTPRSDSRTEMEVEEPIKVQEQSSSEIIVEEEEIVPKAEPPAD